jgi:hypothetical protein
MAVQENGTSSAIGSAASGQQTGFRQFDGALVML